MQHAIAERTTKVTTGRVSACGLDSAVVRKRSPATSFQAAPTDASAKMVVLSSTNHLQEFCDMTDTTPGQDWYAQYLRSEHWMTLKEEKFASARRMCERCGEGAKHRGDRWIGLHVHHLTYERVGHEDMADLQVLCIHCHAVTHERVADTEWNRVKVRRRLAVAPTETDDFAIDDTEWWD
jgi:ribosomal protein S27AE